MRNGIFFSLGYRFLMNNKKKETYPHCMTSFICKCMKFPRMTQLSKRALVIPFAIITFENIDQTASQFEPKCCQLQP